MIKVYITTSPTDYEWSGKETDNFFSPAFWMENNQDEWQAAGSMVPELCHDTSADVKQLLSALPVSEWCQWWVWPWTFLVAVHRDGEDEGDFIDSLIDDATDLAELMSAFAVIKCFAYLTLENREKGLKRHRAKFSAKQTELRALAAPSSLVA